MIFQTGPTNAFASLTPQEETVRYISARATRTLVCIMELALRLQATHIAALVPLDIQEHAVKASHARVSITEDVSIMQGE